MSVSDFLNTSQNNNRTNFPLSARGNNLFIRDTCYKTATSMTIGNAWQAYKANYDNSYCIPINIYGVK